MATSRPADKSLESVAHSWPPEPPSGGSTWITALRWLVTVMDGDDSSLAFVASVLAYALKHDGSLTTKQHQACEQVWQRIGDRWTQGTLACQLAINHPLADVEPQGRA